MKNLKDKKFHKWTVLEYKRRTWYRHDIWLCKCECGNIKEVRESNLLSGKSKQCKECRIKEMRKENGRNK